MATWNDLVASGSGLIEFRLVIEGVQYEFCTSVEMTGDCTEYRQDGKRRVHGLLRQGLGFSETAYLAGASLDVSIEPVTIMETGYPDLDAATKQFSKIPSVVGALRYSLADGEATATVFSTAGFAQGGIYHIGRETFQVVDILDSEMMTLDRVETGGEGFWRTRTATHNVIVAGSVAVARPIYDSIQIYKGRRVWLYAHGDTELDVESVGTCVWRGVLASEPEQVDETAWQLGIESRWTLFEQEVGGGIGSGLDVERLVRGVYYPGESAFTMWIRRSPGANAGGLTVDPVAMIQVAGFFETNGAFVSALVDAISAHPDAGTWGSWSGYGDDSNWELVYTTTGSPRFLEVWGGSPNDGWFFTGFLTPEDSSTGNNVTTAEADTSYLIPRNVYYTIGNTVPDTPPETMRQVPRTISSTGQSRLQTAPFRGSDTDVTNWPLGRVYLDNVQGIITGDSMLVPLPPNADGSDREPLICAITAVDTATGYIEMRGMSGQAYGDLVFSGAGAKLASLKVMRLYGTNPWSGSNLADYRDDLVIKAPLLGNDGSTPWVTDDDLADWTTTVLACAGNIGFLLQRSYAFLQPQRLEDVLTEEAKMYSAFFYLDADFKIALRPLTLETESVSLERHIRDERQLVDQTYGRIRIGDDGQVNVVEYSRGYDAQEDKYTQPPVTVKDIGAIAEAGGRKSVLEVKPKVGSADSQLTAELAVTLSGPVFAMFGGKIIHIEVDVPMTMWPVLIGDSVLLTLEELPYNGARAIHALGQGATNRRATVVGRTWDFETCSGTLTCLVVGVNSAGYAPTARILSVSGSGTAWSVTCDDDHYAQDGTSDASYFRVGDKIRLVQWDAASPTVRSGEIVAIAGDVIDLTLDTSWSGLGGQIYNLIYTEVDSTQDSQLEYAFIADGSQTYEDSSSNTYPARSFAP